VLDLLTWRPSTHPTAAAAAAAVPVSLPAPAVLSSPYRCRLFSSTPPSMASHRHCRRRGCTLRGRRGLRLRRTSGEARRGRILQTVSPRVSLVGRDCRRHPPLSDIWYASCLSLRPRSSFCLCPHYCCKRAKQPCRSLLNALTTRNP
jgi:hypothetical protein